jgi:hypothetical protein
VHQAADRRDHTTMNANQNQSKSTGSSSSIVSVELEVVCSRAQVKLVDKGATRTSSALFSAFSRCGRDYATLASTYRCYTLSLNWKRTWLFSEKQGTFAKTTQNAHICCPPFPASFPLPPGIKAENHSQPRTFRYHDLTATDNWNVKRTPCCKEL